MTATRVIARFVSLLDVVMILVGVLLIISLYADPCRRQDRSNAEANVVGPKTLAEMANLEFIYLYAGWKDEQNGRCYVLTRDGKIGKEVSTTRPDDLQRIMKARRQKNQVILLLFSENGFTRDGIRINSLK